MGFSALQGKVSHEALLSRQDAEIRLIETMKRCLSQKAKCDKEYSMAINNLTQQGLKVDRGDDFLGKNTSFKYINILRNFNSLAKALIGEEFIFRVNGFLLKLVKTPDDIYY